MKKTAVRIAALLLTLCAVLSSVCAVYANQEIGALAARIGALEFVKDEYIRENNRSKILKYIDKNADSLTVGFRDGAELFFYRYMPTVIAAAMFSLITASALFAATLLKRKKHRKAMLYLVLISAVYAGAYIAENLSGSTSMLTIVLEKGAIYSLIAVSMNLLNGFTGLFSLGQAGFMLLGAYTYAIFTIPLEYRAQVYQYFDGGLVQFTLPVPLAIALGGLIAAFFAFLIGLPVLRLKSDYLAIATLGFAEIIRAVCQYSGFGPITNGSNLLRKFATYDTVLFPFAVVGLSILFISLLIHSTYGRSLKAIRDDEIAAEAMGINLFRHKQIAFTVSSFFAGIGGALLAMFQTTVQASTFKASMTYEILLIVVIGGMGSVTGSVIASFIFIAASEWWLRFLDNETTLTILGKTMEIPLMRSGFRMVVFSVVIMLIVLFFRKGIMGDRELDLSRIGRIFGSRRRGKGAVENG